MTALLIALAVVLLVGAVTLLITGTGGLTLVRTNHTLPDPNRRPRRASKEG